jgi:transcriptional regulator with XRE-family HTH domain
LSTAFFLVIFNGMEIKDKIKQIIDSKATNPFATARVAGVDAATLRNILGGRSKDPGVYKVYEIAKALGTTIEDVIDREGLGANEFKSAAAMPELPIVYKTGAGNWVETDDFAQTFLEENGDRALITYADCKQWYEVMEGDSMNQLIPEGALLHVVDTKDFPYVPRHGNIVIVERRKQGGFMRERTVKQIEMTLQGIELWPRSTNPRWRGPIAMTETDDHDESIHAEIVGLVKRAVLRF